MKESIRIAYTFAKVYLDSLDPENNFLVENSLHLHVPGKILPLPKKSIVRILSSSDPDKTC